MSSPAFGLCEHCQHQRVVKSGRGSVFSLCRLSASDPAYAKYPPIPVRTCPGFTARSADGDQQPVRD